MKRTSDDRPKWDDWEFISYYPLKQGLKPTLSTHWKSFNFIYILLSIKSRIETDYNSTTEECLERFISYYPLKQGLKQLGNYEEKFPFSRFISYYPLKQGLKLLNLGCGLELPAPFISYYPLKQGLKHIFPHIPHIPFFIYILLSIKTRIETLSSMIRTKRGKDWKTD